MSLSKSIRNLATASGINLTGNLSETEQAVVVMEIATQLLKKYKQVSLDLTPSPLDLN